ncbi:MAG: collagen binding domain-containing protein [Pseudonocardiaceae bacterium]
MAGFLRRALGGRLVRASAAADPAAGPAAAGPAVHAQPPATEPTTAGPELTPSGAATGPSAAGSPTRLLIFGQVKEGADSPLAGATVTLTDLSGRQLDRDCADSGGHYRLSPPTGGSYLVICASAAHQPTAALVAVAEDPVRHDVHLSGAGASLAGTVRLAETGQPLGEAVVTLVDIGGDVVGAVGTDPQGRFRFVDLAQGHYTLTVAAVSLQPAARGVQIPAEGQVTVDVEVAARVQLAGAVRTGTAGAPVPEALATLLAADGQVVGSVITDGEGGFLFDDLPAGVYTLIASGYPPVAAEVTLGLGPPTETVLTLWPATPDSPLAAMTGNGALGSNTGREDDEDGNY